MARLTKRAIDALTPRASDYFVWDDELRGFGVRVSPKDAKTFMVQYRAAGRTRRVKVGRYGALTVEEARLRARELLGDVAKGENPAEEISIHRNAASMKEICDRFLRDHVEVRLKPTTERNYRTVINDVIKPALGTRKIIDVSRADVSAIHHKYRDRPYQANRILSVLSKLFNLMEVWGLRPDGSNPCRHVQKYSERKRERFLSAEELGRLGSVLADSQSLPEGQEGHETVYVAAAFKLLILTGCRLSEIQFLKWEYVTDTHLVLPDSKTGARKIPLPSAAREILRTLPRVKDNPYVIVGTIEGQAMHDLEKPWRRIRERAELGDVRIHDLRHTYASNAVLSGLSIPMLGKILGHTQIQTTMRYAHLADDPVREAADHVSAGLNKALQAQPPRAPTRMALRIVK